MALTARRDHTKSCRRKPVSFRNCLAANARSLLRGHNLHSSHPEIRRSMGLRIAKRMSRYPEESSFVYFRVFASFNVAMRWDTRAQRTITFVSLSFFVLSLEHYSFTTHSRGQYANVKSFHHWFLRSCRACSTWTLWGTLRRRVPLSSCHCVHLIKSDVGIVSCIPNVIYK